MINKAVSWLQKVGFIASENTGAGRIRAAQIQAVVRFTPLMIIVNLLNAVVVVSCVRVIANPLLLAVWVAAIVLLLVVAGRTWLAGKRREPKPSVSPRAIRKATLNATILALCWSVIPVMWFANSGTEAKLLLGTLITGMICAGGFALATIPTAALCYVAILTAGTLVAVATSFSGYVLPFGMLLLGYAVVVMRSVDGTSRMFLQRFQTEAELAERGDIIELLLNEFEENSSDWLFQTDADFNIVEPSARFAAVASREAASLQGLALEILVDPAHRADLLDKLRSNIPFKDLEVQTADHQAWWSLTAKPIFTKSGVQTGWRGVGSDITARKHSEQQLEHMAYFDALTGLANRARFKDEIERTVEHSVKTGAQALLLLVDLDQFKEVNDTLGHETGDELLKVAARRLASVAGPLNIVTRLGNDEFAIIVTDHEDLGHADRLARQFIEAFGQPVHLPNGDVTVCVSLGLVRMPDHGASTEHVMRNADLALVKAKEIGGSGFAIFDSSMNEVFQDRATLARDLRQAASISGQLEVWYQPQIDINTRTIAGFEALMRWKHPVRGYIPPAEFIPIAENSGLISQMGRWIIKEAILQANVWLKITEKPIPIAVNLSVAQLWHSSIVADVGALLKESGLPPALLCLEMTESLFAGHDAARVHKTLNDLKAIGVTLALDDFGTGYSSLSYLNQLPFDKLKIDRSFIENSTLGTRQKHLLQGIVNLGKGLGMTVIAEGVETEEELALLRAFGCPQIQGYFFGRPAPAPQALARAMEKVSKLETEYMAAPDVSLPRQASSLAI